MSAYWYRDYARPKKVGGGSRVFIQIQRNTVRVADYQLDWHLCTPPRPFMSVGAVFGRRAWYSAQK